MQQAKGENNNIIMSTYMATRGTRFSSHLEQIRTEPPPISEPIPVVKEELLTDAKSEGFTPADFQPAADYQPPKSLHNHVRINLKIGEFFFERNYVIPRKRKKTESRNQS